MTDSTLNAYCVRCKGMRPMADAQPTYLSNGRAAVRGRCPECGTALTRIGATPDHEGLPKPEVVARWRQAGARVHGTADGGALRVRLQAGGITVESRRQSHPRAWDAVRRQRRQAGEGTGQAALVSYRPD